MAKKRRKTNGKLAVNGYIEGKALLLVDFESDMYKNDGVTISQIRIINRLLTELHEIRNKKTKE